MKVFVIVSGEVQGVSFRSFARKLAQEFNLRGLVRNALDGTVELFLDGEQNAIDKFIQMVKQRKSNGFFAMNVKEVRVFQEGENYFKPAWREYTNFEIDF